MTDLSNLFFVAIASALAPAVLFYLLSSFPRRHHGKRVRRYAFLDRLRFSSATTPSTMMTTRRSMLERVAPSPLGFLPARVPFFEFGNILDGFVTIADEVPIHYANEDTLLFRSWLERRLGELFPREKRNLADAALRSLDGEGQRSLLVPLVFLAHAHRWGCTSPPQWVLDEGIKRKRAARKGENAAETKWRLPEEIALPLDSVRAAVGGIQRSGSVSLLFLRNWTLVGGSGEGDDDGSLPLPGQRYSLRDLSQSTLRPRFRFCSRVMDNDCDDDLEAAEASVLHSVVLTEAAASRLPPALLAIFDAAEEAERSEAEEERARREHSRGAKAAAREAAARADAAADEAADAASEVADALRAALSVFHDVFRTSKISTRAWSRHIQPFYCALTSSGEGEEERAGGDGGDVGGDDEEEHGVGGAQIPWVHLTDALFGIAADDPLGSLISRNRTCLLPEERLFVSFVEAHSLKVRRWLSKGASGDGGDPGRSGGAPPPPRSERARLRWNGALSTLVAWRATHRARAAAYLVPAGMGPGGAGGDAPRRGTTGGTASYGGRGGTTKKKRSGSFDEGAEPGSSSSTTPVSVLAEPRKLGLETDEDDSLRAPGAGTDDEGEEEEFAVRASFNRLMDGRISRTRASSIDGGRGGGGKSAVAGAAMSDLFPSA